MNKVKCVLGLSTITVLLASGAAVADPDTARARVRSELVAARQAGELPVGEPEIAPRDMFPWLYPQLPTTAPAKTRAQVRAELIAARRNGELPIGEPEIAPRDMFPWLYPPETTGLASETRAQVQAEASAAVKAGTMPASFVARSERDLFPGEYSQGKASATLAHNAASSHAN